MNISLGWPDKRLSPNARLHWSTTSKVKKAAREAAKYLVWGTHGVRDIRFAFAGDHQIHIKVTFFPPDKRHRDADNIIASCKAMFDGVADALGVNDRRFKYEFHFAEPCAPGRVDLWINSSPSSAYLVESAHVNGDRPSSGAI